MCRKYILRFSVYLTKKNYLFLSLKPSLFYLLNKDCNGKLEAEKM